MFCTSELHWVHARHQSASHVTTDGEGARHRPHRRRPPRANRIACQQDVFRAWNQDATQGGTQSKTRKGFGERQQICLFAQARSQSTQRRLSMKLGIATSFRADIFLSRQRFRLTQGKLMMGSRNGVRRTPTDVPAANATTWNPCKIYARQACTNINVEETAALHA